MGALQFEQTERRVKQLPNLGIAKYGALAA
jgi:hypothetical protein